MTNSTKYTDAEIAEHRQKWIDALRSGDYVQASHYLCSVDPDGNRSYCCLGVACEISGLSEFREHPDMLSGMAEFNHPEYDGSTGALPFSVAEWLNIETSGSIYDESEDLTTYNDQRRWSFEQIADLIENDAHRFTPYS